MEEIKNRKKRIKKEITKKAKIKAVAFSLAIATILASGVFLTKRGLKKLTAQNLLNNCAIEDVLNDDDFKLTSNNPNFINLLEDNKYEIDDEVKNNINMDIIYEIYEYVWEIENNTDDENNKLCQKLISSNLPKFTSTLESLLNTRVPGIITKISSNSIETIKNHTVKINVSKDLLVDNPNDIEIEYYDLYGNVVDKENSIKYAYVLPMQEESTYKINITDDDLLIIMNAVNNKNNKKYFTTDTLKKVISSAIRVSTKNYLMVYDKKEEKDVDFAMETQKVNYTGSLKENSYTYDDKIEYAKNKLKEYLIQYYNLNSKLSDTELVNKNLTWYLIDTKTKTSYKLEHKISSLCNDIALCQNNLQLLKNTNEETAMAMSDYSIYANSEDIEEVTSKIKIKK